MAGQVAVSAGDRSEIRELLSRFCHAWDHGDPGEVVALFLPDARFVTLTGEFQGHEELRGMTLSAVRQLVHAKVTQHWTGNVVVTESGSDEGIVNSYCVSIGIREGELKVAMMSEYADVVAHTPDGWLFKERRIVRILPKHLEAMVLADDQT
jgi:uncharacterized protein (TIGR02246 family)